jgi:MoaA/NifB/PqqE/SkfB family radical SAM enzyme
MLSLSTAAGRRGSVIQIENTNRCNFHCVYCPTHSAGSTLNVTKGTMDFAAFEAILDANPRARMVHLQGQGEPMVDPGIWEKLEACSRRGLYTQIISNGSLLGGETGRRLVDSPLDSLMVSIDVAPGEVVEQTRLGMKYDRVVENLRQIVAYRNERRAPLVVGIISVFYGADEARLEAALREFDALGIDFLEYKELNGSFENRIRDYASREIVHPIARLRRSVGYVIHHQRGPIRDKPCLWLKNDFRYYLVDGRRTACCILNDGQYADAPAWTSDSLMERWRARDLPVECTRCSYFGGY